MCQKCYISFQDHIIEVLGGMITEAIIAEVNEAKFFAVISDEFKILLQ